MDFNKRKWLDIALAVIIVAFIVVVVLIIKLDGAEPSEGEIDDIVEQMEAEEMAMEEPTEMDGDEFSKALNPERDYLIVVNGWHPYEFDGEYDKLLQGDLVYVADSYGEPTPVEKATYLAFTMLKADLWNEYGINISLYSAYRAYEDQEWVYEYHNEEGMNNVAKPLFSEHHTGLVIDYKVWRHDGEWHTETAVDQRDDQFYGLIREKLGKYGFIERYPFGKEDLTGIMCEPNEIRFVGSSEIAQEIMDQGWCLEEYRMKHG